MTTKEIKITRFDGGVSDDVREPSSNKFSISRHFDIYSNPFKLTPYRDREADQTGQYRSGNFLYSSEGQLLALGTLNGTDNYPAITYKAGANLVTDNWASRSTNWEGGSGDVTGSYELFAEYTGYIYFWTTANLCRAYIPYTGGAMNLNVTTLTTTFRAQGLVHSATNILYIPYSTSAGTYIGTVNGTTWAAAVLTISSTLRITSICEYGNYLAIGAYDVNSNTSKVLLWDLYSTKPNQIIDWGNGKLKVLNNLDGILIGISQTPSTVFSIVTSRVVIKRYSGGLPVVMKEIIVNASNSVAVNHRVNFIYNNRLYFAAKFASDNMGIWSIGRKSGSYDYALTCDTLFTNDGSETAIEPDCAAILLGDVMWTQHTTAGTITRTNDASSYTATSIYESQKFKDFPLSHLDKVKVDYVFLPTDGQVILKYRKDEEDGSVSWRQIFKDTTNNSVGHISTTVENTSDTVTVSVATPAVVTLTNHGMTANQPFKFSTTGALPTGITAGTTYYVLSTSLATGTFRFSASVGGSAVNTSGSQSGVHTILREAELPDFKEIQFRIESTGGAEITGLSFTYSSKEPQNG